MKRKHISKRNLESFCGEVHADDGVDPSEFFRPTRKKRGTDRKAMQLCHQVAETLNLVFSGELGDLRVVAVMPAPDVTQLLVVVAAAVAGGDVDREAVLVRLNDAASRLRGEVAAANTRRRTPKLLFQFVDGPSAGEEAR